MFFLLAGLNHKTAPVQVREKIAFGNHRLEEAYAVLSKIDGITGSVIISTCNRVEICCYSEKDNTKDIIKFISEFHNIEVSELEKYIFIHKNKEVFSHLARVSAGLDSMIVGEPQVFGQVKKAYQYAFDNRFVSKQINLLFQKVNNIVKKVRTYTDIGRGAVSVSFAAVQLAKKIFGSLSDAKVMMIGAGEMAELCTMHFSKSNASEIIIANRSSEKSEMLADKFGAAIVRYEDMIDKITDIDVIIVSTGAPHYIITADKMREVMKKRKNNIIFIIDISVPRNVEPESGDIDNVFLYSIDDLQKVADNNMRKRKNDIFQAEKIIEKLTDEYYSDFIKRKFVTKNEVSS